MFDAGLLERLPSVRGVYRENVSLADLTWFRVGGPAQVLFKPKDAEDLADFIKHKPADVSVSIIGVGSNLLIRDGGIPGVVIRLPAAFGKISVDSDAHQVTAGAFALDTRIAQTAAEAGIGHLAFFAGIPGTIGGALRMNAGAHGQETKNVLLSGKVINSSGEILTVQAPAFGHSYRHCDLPSDWLFIEATFQGTPSTVATQSAAIARIRAQRDATQPTKTKTGGSTFKNPPGHSAWKCIDAAGMRGAQVGDAQVSTKHCNFMINTDKASAHDLETLGETIRKRVFETQGVLLDWEIKRVGQHLDGTSVDVFQPS